MEAQRQGEAREFLRALVRLAGLDRERDNNQRLIDRMPELLGARQAEVDRQRAAEERARDELVQARKRAHEAEVDLRGHADQVRKLELQLNTARSNTEYQGLLQQIQRIREESARREDETLATYDRIASLEAAAKVAQERTAAKVREFEEFAAACAADVERARAELAGTEDRRNAFLEQLPPELRAQYERLRSAREGVAIVAIEGRTCGGCGMTLTHNTHVRVMAGTSVVACDSCHRILYDPQALNPSREG